jgi:transcriptional regulator with XRE-family HTH domain
MAASPEFGTVSAQMARSLRAHRDARGLSLGALAAKAGVSKTILSRIEAGLGNPALETLWRITRALDVPLGVLLGEEEPPPTRLIRSDQGELVESKSGLVGRLILAEGRNHRTEIFEFTLMPGSDYASEAHAPGTEELVVLTGGTAAVGPAGREIDLAERDALWFPADVNHRYASADGASGYVVMSYPPAHGMTR